MSDRTGSSRPIRRPLGAVLSGRVAACLTTVPLTTVPLTAVPLTAMGSIAAYSVTASSGTAAIGTVAIGTVAVGTVAVGTVAVGTVAVGTVAVGTIAGGTAALLLTGCDRPGSPKAERVRFGVLFGGQVQERKEIPFELDTSKQSVGFRIEADALDRVRRIRWELTKPSSSGDPQKRVTELGSALLPAHQSSFEQVLKFEPGDPLGLHNIRILLDDRVVLDRPFLVYDPSKR